VSNANRLALTHWGVAFAAFAAAVILGAWQMFVRSPLHPWLSDAELYYRSVTAHGTTLGYVFPTLSVMGLGYAVCATTLDRPLRGSGWGWAGFWLLIAGTLSVSVSVALGRASVLYTFYPPLTGSAFYYLGVALVVVGSWFWIGVMLANYWQWKRTHPQERVPLALFGVMTAALLWGWTSLGAALEILFLILPVALGWKATVDAGLARMLFSWTLHAIVYFWLMPAYIAFYTLAPKIAGGPLYSDRMARVSFIMILVFAMPIGIHHLFVDPQVGSGFKFLHTVFTGMVVIPTLLTVFTLVASLEIAARLRGGHGLLRWVAALPWERPMVLATGLSLLMLALGGAGGIINMSYALNATIHNTQWITGHFHLIYGGAVVIMYFALAYEFWPRLTGYPLRSPSLARTQLWLWFVGMLVVTIPWHVVGLMGQPRRMAYYDWSDPQGAAQAPWVVASALGGGLLLISAALVLIILVRSARGARAQAEPLNYALGMDRNVPLPRALNSFGVWVVLMVALTVVNYGYPIAQHFFLKNAAVPAELVTR
jgi:cytochrome c oxidase subunit 1